MSSVVYATAVFNKRVRSSRRTERGAEPEPSQPGRPGRTREEWADGPQAQTRPPGRRTPFRSAALVLGALSVLMAAALTVLSILHVSVASEKQQLEAKLSNLSCYNQTRLQDEVTDDNQRQAPEECEGESCPEGWRRFGCSCYFRSTEEKLWPLSRKDCQSRGSDLVVIGSPEEKDFVRELSVGGESWIGLRWTENLLTGSQRQWRWVDGSTLTEFWAQVHSEPRGSWAFAVCCNAQGQWREIHNLKENRSWICKSRTSKLP